MTEEKNEMLFQHTQILNGNTSKIERVSNENPNGWYVLSIYTLKCTQGLNDCNPYAVVKSSLYTQIFCSLIPSLI